MKIPVYIFTGLLDSGKTTLIKEVAHELIESGKTLLIQTEKGEISFDDLFCQKYNIKLSSVKNISALSDELQKECSSESPAQILIEYNGTWETDALLNICNSEKLFIDGIYSTVDTTSAELYLANMRKQFMEPLRISNLIVFNRCSESHDRLKCKRIVKGLNPNAQIVFESEAGTIYENTVENMPFDYSQNVIKIEDEDYGLWHLDAQENPDRYMGKEVIFKARFCESREPGKTHFVPGRHVMTCCEDDIEFMGYICYCDKPLAVAHGQWVMVTAKFYFAWNEIYQDDGPLLQLVSIQTCDPPDTELVIFG